MSDLKIKVAVIGGGAWGTSLAHVLAQKENHNVYLWVKEQEVAESINFSHENKIYLSGFTIKSNIKASIDIDEVIKDAQVVVNVVPTQFIRTTWSNVRLSSDAILVNASKGIEQNTLCLISEIFTQVLNNFDVLKRFCVLSGPSFAEEVIQGLPTSVTLASSDLAIAKQISEIFHLPNFRVYTSQDIIGVQLGGALKNVIAIASGAIDGMKLGLNTRAALITRGLTEIARLGMKVGAKYETFSGLSGMGDLILTCTGSLSRNHSVGLRLGKGENLDSILSSVKTVAEGVATAKSAYQLSQKYNVDMPITNAVYSGLYLNTTPNEALKILLLRKLKHDGV